MIGSILFLLIYITSSIKSKKLSSGWLKFLSCYMGSFVLFCLYLLAGVSSPGDEDLGGLIFFFILIINSLCLFGLYLFYVLYYWHLNKNNSEVNYKKPFKIFLVVIGIIVVIIGIVDYRNYREENKKFFKYENVKPDIVEVNSVDDIPKLNEYKCEYDKYFSDEEWMVNEKILLKFSSNDFYREYVKDTVNWEYDSDDYIKNKNYEIYFSSEDEIKNDGFIYLYGTITEISELVDDYDENYTVIDIIPDKIYFINKDNYSINILKKYYGDWCLDDTCLKIGLNDSKKEEIDFFYKDNDDSYYSYDYYPDNIVWIDGGSDMPFSYAKLKLEDDYIELQIDNFEDSSLKNSKYIFFNNNKKYIGKFIYETMVGDYITYLYKENDKELNNNFYYVNALKVNDSVKVKEYGEMVNKDNLFDILIDNNSYGFFITDSNEEISIPDFWENYM